MSVKPLQVFMLLGLLLLGRGFANVTVEGSLTRAFDVRAGAVVEDAITVTNHGTDDASIRVYQTDYTFSANGTIAYPEPNTLERSNSSWITFNSAPTIVPAGQSVLLRYRVEVPYSELQGSYWSMIMVEEISPDPGPGAPPAVRTVVRYGIQVVTTIDSTSPAEILFLNPSFEVDDAGRALLAVDISNTGTRTLRSQLYVDLFDSTGKSRGRFEGQLHRTHPGTSVRQEFDLGQLAAGNYLAIVVADAGGGDVFGAQYNLTVDSD